MNADDIEIIEKTTPFEGYFRIDRYRLKVPLYDGGLSGVMTREVFERGHAVVILLYDADLDRLVLIEQFRPGAFTASFSPWFTDDFSPWLIECAAGIIEAGETPEQVARREAVEEAGCEVGDLIPVYQYIVSPGGSSESVFLFCGRVDASQAGGVFGVKAEHEDIRVLVVPPEEAFGWLDTGRIVNSMTIIALEWFRRNHEAVRARWRTAE